MMDQKINEIKRVNGDLEISYFDIGENRTFVRKVIIPQSRFKELILEVGRKI